MSTPLSPLTHWPADLGWSSVSRKFIGEGSWDHFLWTGMGRLGEGREQRGRGAVLVGLSQQGHGGLKELGWPFWSIHSGLCHGMFSLAER